MCGSRLRRPGGPSDTCKPSTGATSACGSTGFRRGRARRSSCGSRASLALEQDMQPPVAVAHPRFSQLVHPHPQRNLGSRRETHRWAARPKPAPPSPLVRAEGRSALTRMAHGSPSAEPFHSAVAGSAPVGPACAIRLQENLQALPRGRAVDSAREPRGVEAPLQVSPGPPARRRRGRQMCDRFRVRQAVRRPVLPHTPRGRDGPCFPWSSAGCSAGSCASGEMDSGTGREGRCARTSVLARPTHLKRRTPIQVAA